MGSCNGTAVKGDYTYYHFLADGVDDRGWGGRYRSLQTLASMYTYPASWRHAAILPKGKGRIFPKERSPSALLTQSRTHLGPECLKYLITVEANFGSMQRQFKLCYHKLCTKLCLSLSAFSSTVSITFLLFFSIAFICNIPFVLILWPFSHL